MCVCFGLCDDWELCVCARKCKWFCVILIIGWCMIRNLGFIYVCGLLNWSDRCRWVMRMFEFFYLCAESCVYCLGELMSKYERLWTAFTLDVFNAILSCVMMGLVTSVSFVFSLIYAQLWLCRDSTWKLSDLLLFTQIIWWQLLSVTFSFPC